MAGSASDAAQRVAGVAKEQVGQVTAEAGRQVRHLVGQARSELSGQAQTQQQRAAGGLHSVAEQIAAMAQGGAQPGIAIDLAHQAADRVHQIAGWLDDREPAELLDDVRSFARRRPGMFLGLALGAGLVAGRLARGLAAADKVPAGAPVRRTPALQTPPSPPTRELSATQARPALPEGLDSDLYGTGEVPDWTGKTVAEVGESR